MTPIATERQLGVDDRTVIARQKSFGQLLRAEWTKFRSVRGWVIGMFVAVVLSVLVGVFAAGNASIGCSNGPAQPQLSGKACLPYIPIGPGGEAVSDSFYFVRQPMTGNGSITVRLTSLTGKYSDGNGHVQVGHAQADMRAGLVPWAKAGIIIKASTRQGSAYAAILVTGSHGVRMQYDYTHDIAGLPGAVSAASPRWVRLVRSGSTISGYDSADGRHWSLVGVARLAGLGSTVQAGLFATSPQYVKVMPFFGGATNQGGPSVATGVFDNVSLQGHWLAGAWTGTAIGSGARADYPDQGGGYHQAAGQFTVTGSGDIAPAVPGPGSGFASATFEDSLAGMFAGLIAVAVVAAMFFTGEYRRGLIRVTFAATPRRGRVLAAKAVVAGSVAFVAGLAAAIVCIWLGLPRQRAQGLYVLPVSGLTEARVLAGTAAMVAVTAVFAVALGAVLRRSAAAVTTVIALSVLPFLLAVSVLPPAAAAWLLRVTPAAGFAIEQSIPNYPQLDRLYSPAGGSYPLAPWAGLLVLCCWAAAALVLAMILLRRRDA
jgi:ABC-type transport system involved in multi-copper enzyme maturation permease subunit